jgi:hypothetical protein
MRQYIYFILFYFIISKAEGQNSSDSSFKPHGEISGLFFGDYAYKLDADSLKRGNLEYSGLPKNNSQFNIRRLYFGYEYFASPKFSMGLVLASEGQIPSTSNRNIFIKYLGIRWKNIFIGSDLYFGQIRTPTFALMEKVWGFRAVEKTITDQRLIAPSSDLGVSLQGILNKHQTLGYTIMVANGSGIRPENDKYKKLYTNLVAKFAQQKIILDLNYNYEFFSPVLHRSRQTFKVGAAYQTKKFAMGAEAFDDELNNFGRAVLVNRTDTTLQNQRILGISVFLTNNWTKKISSFIRFDRFNPDKFYNSSTKYIGTYANYNETFFTAGLDFQPIEKVHIIPNIWYNHYHNKNNQPTNLFNGNDLVARCTVYVIFK